MERNATRPFASIAMASILAFSCCFPLTSCAGKKAAPKIDGVPKDVRAHRAEARDYSADIESFGSVVYTQKSDVSAAVEGIVSSISVREGDSVRRGRRLAQLANVQLTINRDQAIAARDGALAATRLTRSEYEDYRRQIESVFLSIEQKEIELARSERALSYMENDLNDQEKLFAIGGISAEVMRSARHSMESARSEHDILKKGLEIARIGYRDADLASAGYHVPANRDEKRRAFVELNSRTKKAELDVALSNETTAQTQLSSAEALVEELSLDAPIDGVVGAIYKESGERVEQGEKVMTLFSSNDAWVVFPVNEGDVTRIRQGMKVRIQIDALPNETLSGVVDIVSPTVDPQSGNVTIKALVKGMDARSRPGMFARVCVITDIPTRKILIPLTCLAQRQDKEGVVMTIRDGTVFRRKISLGVERKGEIEVTSGLSEGENVVLEPTPILREGDNVTVRE